MIGLVLVLFGNSLFRSRVVGAVVTIALGALALLYGLFVHGLGTSQVLLWLGVGVLLLFAGVARVTTRLVPPLSKVLSPVARWAMLVLMIVALPIWLPIWGFYWLYRYAAFTPGWGVWRILALVVFVVTILNPIALDRRDHVDPEGARSAGSPSGPCSSRASCPSARARSSAARTAAATRSAPPRPRPHS